MPAVIDHETRVTRSGDIIDIALDASYCERYRPGPIAFVVGLRPPTTESP